MMPSRRELPHLIGIRLAMIVVSLSGAANLASAKTLHALAAASPFRLAQNNPPFPRPVSDFDNSDFSLSDSLYQIKKIPIAAKKRVPLELPDPKNENILFVIDASPTRNRSLENFSENLRRAGAKENLLRVTDVKDLAAQLLAYSERTGKKHFDELLVAGTAGNGTLGFTGETRPAVDSLKTLGANNPAAIYFVELLAEHKISVGRIRLLSTSRSIDPSQNRGSVQKRLAYEILGQPSVVVYDRPITFNPVGDPVSAYVEGGTRIEVRRREPIAGTSGR